MEFFKKLFKKKEQKETVEAKENEPKKEVEKSNNRTPDTKNK